MTATNDPAMVLKLRSPAIAPGGHIPAKYTCDGYNRSRLCKLRFVPNPVVVPDPSLVGSG